MRAACHAGSLSQRVAGSLGCRASAGSSWCGRLGVQALVRLLRGCEEALHFYSFLGPYINSCGFFAGGGSASASFHGCIFWSVCGTPAASSRVRVGDAELERPGREGGQAFPCKHFRGGPAAAGPPRKCLRLGSLCGFAGAHIGVDFGQCFKQTPSRERWISSLKRALPWLRGRALRR